MLRLCSCWQVKVVIEVGRLCLLPFCARAACTVCQPASHLDTVRHTPTNV